MRIDNVDTHLGVVGHGIGLVLQNALVGDEGEGKDSQAAVPGHHHFWDGGHAHCVHACVSKMMSKKIGKILKSILFYNYNGHKFKKEKSKNVRNKNVNIFYCVYPCILFKNEKGKKNRKKIFSSEYIFIE